MNQVRVLLPTALQDLSGAEAEVVVEVADPPTLAAVFDQVEGRYPSLRGTIRHPVTGARRAYLRFFACGEDLSHEGPEAPLPDEVRRGEEPLRVVGAIAGG